MAIIILISSLGATGYERYCGCSGEIFNSVFINSKSDCCSHKPGPKVKSCCSSKKSKTGDNKCGTLSKKCCDTKVTYNHYDAEASIDFQSENLFDNYTIPANTFQSFQSTNPKRIFSAKFLEQCFKFTDSSPPFQLSGRDLLCKIQVSRC